MMKQGVASAKNGGNGSYSVIPPSNFSYIEESICRCSLPLNRQNIAFLQSTSINFVVNISGKKFEPAVVTYFEDKSIDTKMLLQEGETPPSSPIADFDRWIGSALEIILSKSCTNVVLIVGSTENFYDCLVIACMRRLQEWSFVSILAEFRHLTWPHKLFDFEQIVDQFHTTVVDITTNIPDFLAIHDNFKEEEVKLLERCLVFQKATDVAISGADSQVSLESSEKAAEIDSTTVGAKATVSSTSSTETAASEQIRIDNILKKLFFSPGNLVISEGTVFDASISLINEKDEED